MTHGEPNIYLSAAICLTAAPLVGFFDRFVSVVLGMYHSPGCAHRDAKGRVIVGTTRPEQIIYGALKLLGIVSGGLGAILLAVGLLNGN